MSSYHPSKSLLVCAGLLEKNGTYLIAQRPEHKHLGGFWEFPGGKIQAGETPQIALQRELKEELGILVQVRELFLEHTHQYNDRIVQLMTYHCTTTESPRPLEHSAIEWVAPQQMKDYPISAADLAVIEKLLN